MVKTDRLLLNLMMIFLINLLIIIFIINIFNLKIGLNELTLPPIIFGLLTGFVSKLSYAKDIKQNLFFTDSFIGRFKQLRQMAVFIFICTIMSVIAGDAEMIMFALILYLFNTVFVVGWLLFYELKNGAVYIRNA
ncbi:MAG: hypothetical protein LLG40_07985 [Deltaproteobacteria bacterium]|nr:hypothetical protein [Deltaproteobacteria bacterium]